MAYDTNRFCWHGLQSTDPDQAAAFYAKVLPWTTMSAPMGDDEATMFVAAEVPVAHYMKVPMEGVPSHWNNYLRVDDVDASTKKAVESGGSQIVPPTDIPVGRFSVVTTPSGGAVSLFHEADEATAEHHPGGMGGFSWTELHSADIDKDLPWLKAVFGFDVGEMPMPQGGTYYLLKIDDEMRAGACQKMMEEAPAMWLTWVNVPSCDDSLAAATEHGGKVLMPGMDMEGVGRMGILQDPTGGVIGVLQPS